MGVLRNALKTTAVVSNTAEEAKAVANELIRDGVLHKAENIILVTSAFHMRRAKLIFEKAGFLVNPFPVDYRVCQDQGITILDFLPSSAGLEQTEIGLREAYGYFYYRLLLL